MKKLLLAVLLPVSTVYGLEYSAYDFKFGKASNTKIQYEIGGTERYIDTSTFFQDPSRSNHTTATYYQDLINKQYNIILNEANLILSLAQSSNANISVHFENLKFEGSNEVTSLLEERSQIMDDAKNIMEEYFNNHTDVRLRMNCLNSGFKQIIKATDECAHFYQYRVESIQDTDHISQMAATPYDYKGLISDTIEFASLGDKPVSKATLEYYLELLVNQDIYKGDLIFREGKSDRRGSFTDRYTKNDYLKALKEKYLPIMKKTITEIKMAPFKRGDFLKDHIEEINSQIQAKYGDVGGFKIGPTGVRNQFRFKGQEQIKHVLFYKRAKDQYFNQLKNTSGMDIVKIHYSNQILSQTSETETRKENSGSNPRRTENQTRVKQFN